ncbi:protocadherin gamma-A4-like [Nothoprocta perdicaria]|uniref:protocadherin gamma-A4-like n=1 Tax=Nothoprocta perdicaria TaxID=30464 RepID=UPI000E1BB234|nr:protocadherin gamma-A4-like [Nothoprocta perdicaria]
MRALLWCALVAIWEVTWGQLRYSVLEEMQKGSFVGDVAKDLGLELSALRNRSVRILSEGRKQYFSLHEKTGHLVTVERIDRERVCERMQMCLINLEILVESYMKIFKVEIEITDLNDNAPKFHQDKLQFRISETAAVGMRFPLEEAQDEDVGLNALQRYELSGDEHFALDVQTGPDGSKNAELVLTKALDREEAALHELVLTAVDGGNPARTGTAWIRVVVLDANDNAPVFSQAVYTVHVREDVPIGSRLLTVNATDADEDTNAEVTYSLRRMPGGASRLFQVNPRTGDITTAGTLDYEEVSLYELEVQAKDGGDLLARAKVLVNLMDVNDNVPEIIVTSVVSSVFEDSPSGTIIALLKVKDEDSGAGGKVTMSLPDTLPFRLHKSFEDYYRVETSRELDREAVSEYNVTVRATDGGSPALWSSAVLPLRVLDVNDNAPVFAEARYSARVPENNAKGALVLRVADSRKSQLGCPGGSCCNTLPAAPPPDKGAPLLLPEEPASARGDAHSGDALLRFSVGGAAFPADFCEGTLPYSYNLCVAPARAVAECALVPAPLPSRAVDDLLSGDAPAMLTPGSSCAPAEPSSDLNAVEEAKTEEVLETGNYVSVGLRSPTSVPSKAKWFVKWYPGLDL